MTSYLENTPQEITQEIRRAIKEMRKFAEKDDDFEVVELLTQLLEEQTNFLPENEGL